MIKKLEDDSSTIDENWNSELQNVFNDPRFISLIQFLLTEKNSGKSIYPPDENIFAAFELTPFDKVKVVILGQDPYHGPGQANGLSFSVNKGMKKPPSLLNIFKELQSDLGYPIPEHGDLSCWAREGVLLLNAVLTVEAGKAASHHKKGWEFVTDSVIKTLSDRKENLVFILWGKFASGKEKLIDTHKHHVIKSAHPSPLSAYNGFFGSRPFSRANELLCKSGLQPVDWRIE